MPSLLFAADSHPVEIQASRKGGARFEAVFTAFIADRPLRDGATPFWHEGIEALRISDDGRTIWNKSSSDGNEQGNRLFPLMFPGTIPADDAFIANHHYRQIQKLLEELDR